MTIIKISSYHILISFLPQLAENMICHYFVVEILFVEIRQGKYVAPQNYTFVIKL